MSSSRGNRARVEPGEVPFIDPTRKWFVVQCKPARDVKAAERLAAAKVDVWTPLEVVTIVRRNRKVETPVRLFASYLFAGIGRDRNGEPDYEPLYDRTFTLGVLGGNCHAEFPVDALQLLAERLSGHARDETEQGKRREAAARFAVGEYRKLVGGPFVSFFAEVLAVLDNGRVRAAVTAFGRKTAVELDPVWLGVA